MTAQVVAVCQDGAHRFSKMPQNSIEIIAGLGVKGDAHAGQQVQHLSRVKANPDAPNLRQVHLIHSELFEEMAQHGFALKPGDLGENITTCGIDLLALGRGTKLRIGEEVVLEVTGLRNPCAQIDHFAPGLLQHMVFKSENRIVRKTGIMTIVLKSGIVRPDQNIFADPPAGPHIPLERV